MFKPKPTTETKVNYTIRLEPKTIELLKSWGLKENIRPSQLAAQIIEYAIETKGKKL